MGNSKSKEQEKIAAAQLNEIKAQVLTKVAFLLRTTSYKNSGELINNHPVLANKIAEYWGFHPADEISWQSWWDLNAPFCRDIYNFIPENLPVHSPLTHEIDLEKLNPLVVLCSLFTKYPELHSLGVYHVGDYMVDWIINGMPHRGIWLEIRQTESGDGIIKNKNGNKTINYLSMVKAEDILDIQKILFPEWPWLQGDWDGDMIDYSTLIPNGLQVSRALLRSYAESTSQFLYEIKL